MATGFALPKVTETSEFPLVPEGLYLFRLKSMENMGLGASFDGKEPKERVRWIFEIEEVISGDDESEDFVGQDFHAWTSYTMNIKSTMYKWATALLGREIDKDEEVGVDDLLGKRGRANVEHYEKKSGDTGHRIASMIKNKAPKKPKPVPVEDDDDELF